MKEFRILMYEDTEDWKIGFELRLKTELEVEGISLNLQHRLDTTSIMQDLEMLPRLILVDYDLGASTGEDVLAFINEDPQYVNVPVILYSGGESIENLRTIAKAYIGVRCFIKDGDDLFNAVANKGRAL